MKKISWFKNKLTVWRFDEWHLTAGIIKPIKGFGVQIGYWSILISAIGWGE